MEQATGMSSVDNSMSLIDNRLALLKRQAAYPIIDDLLNGTIELINRPHLPLITLANTSDIKYLLLNWDACRKCFNLIHTADLNEQLNKRILAIFSLL